MRKKKRLVMDDSTDTLVSREVFRKFEVTDLDYRFLSRTKTENAR